MNNSQKVAETIEILAKDKGVTISAMLSELGLNKNAVFTMKNGGYLPRVENLSKIADYLECSVDYLLGRTDTPEPETPPPDIRQEFLNVFDKLDFDDKLDTMQFARDKMKKGA
ncbi:MAG: helix-turn-helix transcriptional regulator [Oscillospiraceae bacterium]|nr:helix-turn-helix transcriptional regulator [Oscillospiraceae bacterium]